MPAVELHVGRVHEHLPVGALRRDERQIGPPDQAVLLLAEAALGDPHRCTRDALAQVLGDAEGIDRGSALDHERELVAADPERATVGRNRRQRAGETFEQLVAGLVPARVVRSLEPVKIHDRERKPGVRRHEAVQALMERSVIGEAGQAVSRRRVAQPVDLGPARVVEPPLEAEDGDDSAGEEQAQDEHHERRPQRDLL